MTKRNVTPAILVAVVVSVLLAGLVAARPDTYTNSNMDQNSNSSNTSGRASSTSGSQNTNASMLDSSDKKFMMEAGMGGMAEVEMARVALQRASSEAVKQYAQRMIDDHTKAGQELTELASTKGVTLATALDTKHTNMLTKMQQLSGAEFDRAYIKEAGVKSHEKMEKLFMREAERGKDADTKAFASKTLPTVQDHLRMAREMSVGSGTGTKMSTSGGNSNMSGNMNSSGNSNMSNTNMSNSNMSGNMNMSNSNMSNSNMSDSNGNTNMSGNDNTSGNSNATNSNGNSNMTNSNGNSNNPR
jgi:putative membrane protein